MIDIGQHPQLLQLLPLQATVHERGLRRLATEQPTLGVQRLKDGIVRLTVALQSPRLHGLCFLLIIRRERVVVLRGVHVVEWVVHDLGRRRTTAPARHISGGIHRRRGRHGLACGASWDGRWSSRRRCCGCRRRWLRGRRWELAVPRLQRLEQFAVSAVVLHKYGIHRVELRRVESCVELHQLQPRLFTSHATRVYTAEVHTTTSPCTGTGTGTSRGVVACRHGHRDVVYLLLGQARHEVLVTQLAHEFGDVTPQDLIHAVDEALVELLELLEIAVAQHFLHPTHLWEVTHGQVVLLVQLVEHQVEVLDEFALLGVLSPQRGHLAPQVGDDVRMDLRQPRPLDKLIHLHHSTNTDVTLTAHRRQAQTKRTHTPCARQHCVADCASR